jgi:hypothetical protein
MDTQRVTVHPIEHNNDIPAVGLLFTRTKFDDLVSKQYPPSEYCFHPSFFDAVFDLTKGHVGAILHFIEIILAHDIGTFSFI